VRRGRGTSFGLAAADAMTPRAVPRNLLAALYVAAAIVAACAAAGCTTSLADARDAKGSGTAKIYDKPYDTVWNAVMKSIKATRLDLVLDNKEKGIILGQGKVGPFTHGENVAIFVDDLGGSKTRVEVVNKRASAVNITARDWESRIFEDLDKRLD
jgi:hypothetical protein